MLSFIPLHGAVGILMIILLTIVVRLLLTPLTYLRVRGERRHAALAPKLAALRRRTVRTPNGWRRRLSRSTATKAPVFMVLYRTFTSVHSGVLARCWGVLGAVAWWNSRRSRRRLTTSSTGDSPLVQLTPLLPYLTALYLTTSTTWTALEQAVYGVLSDRNGRIAKE